MMASYKSGFDPPPRPSDATRSRRQGTYIQPGTIRQEHRETDIAHLSGQMELRRVVSPVGRVNQPGLPRYGVAEGASRPLETQAGGTASRFGFARTTSKAVPPEMKSKTSRNVLRRKASSIAQHAGVPRPHMERSASASPTKWTEIPAEQRPSIEASLKAAEAYSEIFTRTRPSPKVAVEPPIIPELDRYRTRPGQVVSQRTGAEIPKLATQDLPPSAPLYSGTSVHSAVGSTHSRYSGYSGSGYSASPSTRFSESPGPGAYSRDTTPTSISSQSPGIIAPLINTTPRLRQGSPAFSRPPVTRRRAGSTPNETEAPSVDPHGLPSLRESVTSSSSSSTVKGEHKKKAKRKKEKRLSPLPPSPPPRKSSQNFTKAHLEQESPSRPSQTPAKSVMTSPSESPAKPHNTPSHIRNKSIPPVRPSREGAPDLQEQFGDSLPVIQSNLAGISFSQNRRASAIYRNNTTSPILPQGGIRPPQISRIPSRNPSPSPVLTSPREATPAPSGLGIIPDLRPQLPVPSKSIASRTPSPSVGSKSRFGLFGRRTKTAPEVTTLEKGTRKGPAAGTGHEGYGKYNIRGRSSSAGGLGRGRDGSLSIASSSQESIASTVAYDPFLLQRMSPVIIAGGGEIVENRNASSELARTTSNTSLPLDRPSLDAKGSVRSGLSNEISRTTLWPSALPREAGTWTSVTGKARRPSDSSDDAISNRSGLAFRRSIQMNPSVGGLRLPRPLNITGMGNSSSVTSLGTSIRSDESSLDDRGRRVAGKPKKLEKRPRSPRKWNFFHRSQPTPKPETAVQVTVGRPAVKAVPHYAMLDSSDEPEDFDAFDMEDILRDSEVVELTNEELDALQFGHDIENIRRMAELQTDIPAMQPSTKPEPTPVLFSSPEPVTPELRQTDLHLTQETAPVRPSRLAQVGRIPKVISARPQATSPKSFSRPFARLSTLQPLSTGLNIDKQSVALGPSPPKPSTPEPQMQHFKGRQDSETTIESTSEATAASQRDFLAFSPRKYSETTTSSGESIAGTTAVVPEAHAALEEDEVWDEYDDLMENDETMKVPVSATSSHGVPFQYESYESRRMRKSKMQVKESPTIQQEPVLKENSPPRKSGLTSSSVYSADLSARIKDALKTVPSPTTPMSFTDFFSGYGDRNNSVHGDSARKSVREISHRQSTSSSSRGSGSVLRAVEPENNSPISQVNLRVGSMTVSKWLTFGHVLFSPAREDVMQSEKRHSILVIDGLGNDDWSFYAAETYPHCTFYNLSPTRPLSPSHLPTTTSSSFPLTPPNHRQIHHPTPQTKFPFPSSTFHLVVFRFPTAMSEPSYRTIISECKRVLKPGGYMEMAILDLDMMNMGNRARRAVRALKLQMQAVDPAVCLGSASDTVLRIVGRRGFTDVKSCNVGVPVASAIPSSEGKPREELSLADMMRDESRAADEGITKMVAKVGRWWYTRCYEGMVLNQGTGDERSIFQDGPLLNECEKWNASFKLVVAYAQKPDVGRRRTASV